MVLSLVSQGEPRRGVPSAGLRSLEDLVPGSNRRNALVRIDPRAIPSYHSRSIRVVPSLRTHPFRLATLV